MWEKAIVTWDMNAKVENKCTEGMTGSFRMPETNDNGEWLNWHVCRKHSGSWGFMVLAEAYKHDSILWSMIAMIQETWLIMPSGWRWWQKFWTRQDKERQQAAYQIIGTEGKSGVRNMWHVGKLRKSEVTREYERHLSEKCDDRRDVDTKNANGKLWKRWHKKHAVWITWGELTEWRTRAIV